MYTKKSKSKTALSLESWRENPNEEAHHLTLIHTFLKRLNGFS